MIFETLDTYGHEQVVFCHNKDAGLKAIIAIPNTTLGPALGGTCLNVGCIPSKTLLESSEQYHHIRHGMDAHGIYVEGVRLDLDKMMARKDDIVLQLTNGIGALFKANGVEWLQGHGKLLAERQVEITARDGSVEVV